VAHAINEVAHVINEVAHANAIVIDRNREVAHAINEVAHANAIVGATLTKSTITAAETESSQRRSVSGNTIFVPRNLSNSEEITFLRSRVNSPCRFYDAVPNFDLNSRSDRIPNP
jgi:hypothetical protein